MMVFLFFIILTLIMGFLLNWLFGSWFCTDCHKSTRIGTTSCDSTEISHEDLDDFLS